MQFRYIKLCTPSASGGCQEHGADCTAPGKRPLAYNWASDWSLERDPAHNAGVLTGPESGLLVIDIDTEEAAEQYAAWGLPPTFSVLSGRGYPGRHAYFRWPAGLARVPNRLDGVEIKGPGRQVVAWDSLHKSGQTYQKLGGTVAELPTWFVDRLRTATNQHDSFEVTDATPEALDQLDKLLALLPPGRELRDGNIETVCPAHPDHDPSLVLTASGDRVLVHCRAGCTSAEVLAALGESPAALFPPPTPGVLDPAVIAAERERLAVSTTELTPEVSPAVPAEPKYEWTGAELFAADWPPIATLTLLGQPGYVGEGLSNLVAAYPKVGKTTLMVAFVREQLLAGHRVLYYSEEPKELWSRRVGPEPWWARFVLVPAMGLPVDALLQRIGPEDIVIVDTLRGVLGWDDENDNAKVAAAVAPWILACREAGATFIALHHVNKMGGRGGRGITGGHGLLGQFDQSLEISEGSGTERKVKALGRIGYRPDLTYELVGGELKARRPQLDVLNAAKITEAAEKEQWITFPGRAEIMKRFTLSQDEAEEAISYLVQQGRVVHVKGKSSLWQ